MVHLYAAHDYKTLLGKKKKNFIDKLNNPSENFLKRTLLAQSQIQRNTLKREHKIKLDDIMKAKNFVDVLPSSINKSRVVSFLLKDAESPKEEKSAHIIAIKILREDNDTRYRLFDPNYGETRKLDSQSLKTALQNLFNKDALYSQLNHYSVSDTKLIIDKYNLAGYGAEKYPKAKSISHLKLKKVNLKAIAYLIEKGADINYERPLGYTVLGKACTRKKDIEVVKFLIEKGGDISLKAWLETMHHSIMWGQTEMLKILLKKVPYCDDWTLFRRILLAFGVILLAFAYSLWPV